MKKTLLSLGLVLATAAPMAAQNINNSDVISVGVVGGTVGGFYSPAGLTSSFTSTTPTAALSSVATTFTALASTGGALTSSIPGATTTAAASSAVLAIVSGGSTAAVAAALAGDGAPQAETAAVLSKLAGLGANPSPAAVVAAITAFNAMINASSAAFLSSPSVSTVVAMHAVLSGFGAQLGK